MKKSLMALGMIVALLTVMVAGSLTMAPKTVLAEGEVKTNTVSVNGIGSITVKPDIAFITIIT